MRVQNAAGRSDRGIIGFSTDRCGEFVRYRPPMRATAPLPGLGAMLLPVVGVAIVWRAARTRRLLAGDGHSTGSLR